MRERLRATTADHTAVRLRLATADSRVEEVTGQVRTLTAQDTEAE